MFSTNKPNIAAGLCILGAFLFLAHFDCSAGTIIREDNNAGNGLTVRNPDGDPNIFLEINRKLGAFRRGDRNVDPKNGMPFDPEAGLPGLQSVRQAFLCPICREPFYKHSDPKFQCVPKDENGDAVRVATIAERKGQCPVCNANFTGTLRCNINDKAGSDHDFCIHSLGKAVIHSSVWVCPDCGYGALYDKFNTGWDDKPLKPDVVSFVRAKLAPGMHNRLMKQIGVKDDQIGRPGFKDVDKFAEYITQDQIKDWIKYDNAILVYREEKAPHALMARMYLEGAHACRRELNAELIVPFLHTVVQEGLSQSIRRVQNDLTVTCLDIRRSRQIGGLFDPNRPETDVNILLEACKMIADYGEKTGMRPQPQGPNSRPANASQVYTKGDMYVLYLRYAGLLDRVGRMDDAEKMLKEARNTVPPDSSVGQAEPLPEEAAKFWDKQLQRVRDFVDDRKKCLAKEREYLTRAMWENLTAVHQGEIRFSDPRNWLKSTDKDGMDPANTAYTLGELARRCNEPAAAPAWFLAAKKIVEKQSEQLDLEEKAFGPELASPNNKALRDRADALRRRWDLVRDWTTEQSALCKIEGEVDSKIRTVLEKVLEAAYIDPKTFKLDQAALVDAQVMSEKTSGTPNSTPTEKKDPAVKPVTPAQPAAVAPPADSRIKTRDALYKLYYDAIKEYVKNKKSKPPNLKTLVAGNYILADDSCLNGAGRLICPETGEPLNYSLGYELGSSEDFVLFSSKNAATSKTLFADGTIRIPAKGK